MNIDSIQLTKGIHIIKLYSYGNFNLGNITFSLPTAISNINNDNVLIYPNPASDLIYLESKNSNSQIQIFSVDGKMQFQSFSEDVNKINVKNWNRGIYIIKVISVNSIQTSKIVLK